MQTSLPSISVPLIYLRYRSHARFILETLLRQTAAITVIVDFVLRRIKRVWRRLLRQHCPLAWRASPQPNSLRILTGRYFNPGKLFPSHFTAARVFAFKT